jgi:hypothetical protein
MKKVFRSVLIVVGLISAIFPKPVRNQSSAEAPELSARLPGSSESENRQWQKPCMVRGLHLHQRNQTGR